MAPTSRHHANTFESRYAILYNLRILTRLFQPGIGRKWNIQPRLEKQYSYKKECAARRYSESDSSCMRCFFSLNFGESGYHDYYTKRGMKKPVRTQRTYTVSELNDAFMLWVNLSVRICHFRSASSTGVSYILGAKSDWETGRDKRARAGAGSE